MSNVERYKELFLQSVFGAGNRTVRKWVGNYCEIVLLDNVGWLAYRQGVEKPVAVLDRFATNLLHGYYSLTPFCGIYFTEISQLVYSDEDVIVATLSSGNLALRQSPPRIRVSIAGRITSAVVECDITASLNDPQNAGSVTQSLGFATWPDVPLFDFRGGTLRPSFDAAVLVRMLYTPATPFASSAGDLEDKLGAIASEAVQRAEANRRFFEIERYQVESDRIFRRRSP